MAAVEFDTISEADLGDPPPGLDGNWLYVVADIPSLEGGNAALANWEASLLFGAVAERASRGANLADVVGGMELKFRRANGATNSGGGRAMVNVAASQVFGSATSEEQDRARLDRIFESYGLELTSVDYMYPLDRAARMVAIVESPKTLDGRLYKLFSEVTENLTAYEGAFLELELPDGSPIVRLHGEFRAASGGEWVRPGLEEIVGGRLPPAGSDG